MDEFNVLHFDNGVSYLVDDETYKWFVKKRPFLGRPNDTGGELFGAPTQEIDQVIQSSGGNITVLEHKLGLPEDTFRNLPLHRIDIQNVTELELNLHAAIGNEAGAGEYWNTPTHADGSLPGIDYRRDSDGRIEKSPLNNDNPNYYVDINASSSPGLSELKGNYNAFYDYPSNDSSPEAMNDYITQQGLNINGAYTCEFKKGENGESNKIIIHHPANAEGYDYKTSGGLHEAVLNQVPNDEAHVTHTTYGEIAPGQVDIKHPMPNHEAYLNSHDIKADPEQPRAPTESTDDGSSAKLISGGGNDESTKSTNRKQSAENTPARSEHQAQEISADASSLASETHDSTHSSDDIAKDNSHADADATEAKRDSASESKEASKDIASEPEGAGAKEQQNSSQAEQGDHEQASSKTSANAADDSLSRTKTADVSEKATESGSGSLEHETGKEQHASETADNTSEESGQTSTMQPDNNLAKDANDESSHGQSESNAQNTEPSHASPDQAKQSDESRTNNSDGMPSKGRDTHLSNDAAMPPNTYQHNSDQNETAEGMSGSENVAVTSDKSDSKASTQNSEVSENSTPRNDDSAQIPNSVDGQDTNSGAEKASGNSLNSSGSTNEFKNNGYQQ